MSTRNGFEEVPHTADWSMKVWAEDLPALFVAAAQGMNSMTGMQITAGPRVNRPFEYEGGDTETLLVAFLSELLYLQELEQLGFDSFQVEIQGNSLRAEMQGAQLVALAKPIKAVTFHDLEIRRTPSGFETNVVFDV